MSGTFSILRSDLRPFRSVYTTLLMQLLHMPTEINERTGTRVAVIPGGTSFGLDLSERLLPSVGLRKLYPKVAAAEIAWYLSGQRDATWLQQHAPIWDKFVETIRLDAEEDTRFDFPINMGAVPETLRLVTEPVPMLQGGWGRQMVGYEFEGVYSAYGYRWRHHFERDQIALAIEALMRDPSDRRVVVSAWDPAQDGLGARGQRNVPCPAMFTLSISAGALHSTMLLRSSDVFVGLPYDVMGHALLMDALAKTLDVGVGVATFTLAHAHLYECHFEMARECLNLAGTPGDVVPPMTMPGWPIKKIEEDRDGYVALVKAMAKCFDWPTYAPRPEVVA